MLKAPKRMKSVDCTHRFLLFSYFSNILCANYFSSLVAKFFTTFSFVHCLIRKCVGFFVECSLNMLKGDVTSFLMKPISQIPVSLRSSVNHFEVRRNQSVTIAWQKADFGLLIFKHCLNTYLQTSLAPVRCDNFLSQRQIFCT